MKSENAKSVGNTRDRRRRIVDRERLKCADTIHSNAKIYIYFSNKIYESVPKIIINDTINLVFKTASSILVISNDNIFQVLFDKIANVILFDEISNYILALKMASPGIRHRASCCISALSFLLCISIRGVGTIGTGGQWGGYIVPLKFRTCASCTTEVKDAAYVKILSKRL